MPVLAGISASNEDLWAVVLVLSIIAITLWIVFTLMGRRP